MAPHRLQVPAGRLHTHLRGCRKADKEALEAAQKALEQNIKNQAKTIAELYINVPKTTDFAIMFLATEGFTQRCCAAPACARKSKTSIAS